MTAHEIESMGKKNPITGNVTMTADECRTPAIMRSAAFAEKSEKLEIQAEIRSRQIKNAKIWKRPFEKLNKDYEELETESPAFLDAIEIASEKLSGLLSMPSARGKGTV